MEKFGDFFVGGGLAGGFYPRGMGLILNQLRQRDAQDLSEAGFGFLQAFAFGSTGIVQFILPTMLTNGFHHLRYE